MKKWLIVAVLALVVMLLGSASSAEAPKITISATWGSGGQWDSPQPGRAWLGVSIDYDEGEGDMITEVTPFSPAATAGLRRGDRIVAMFKVQHRWDGSYSFRLSDPPFRIRDFQAYCRPGDLVLIVFWRDDGGSWLWYDRTPHLTVAVAGSK